MFKIYGKMFFKAFFIQALWNFERLQNIGFLFVLKPFLDKVYLNPDRRKEAMIRHLGFFNTHPYMANIILAMVSNIEKEIASDKRQAAADVNFIKNAMAGPLAAIGDSFFWGTLRPVTAFLSIFLVILFARVLDPAYSWIAPLTFLFLYNFVHIPIRYWMFFISLKLDNEMLALIAKLEFKFLGDIVRYAGLLIVLTSLIFYFKIFGFGPVNINFFGTSVPDALTFCVVLILSIVFGRFSATFMFYCVVLFCILLSYLGI
ncbi:MAG: PTS system mannose/fructose/sorbose family transporter subunit IID [Endomicrobia bacterium]|jgi:PTS system mannose-specific IID component|nr:PTS system mannose/fructose/sorbose family transporter subunit IID [Endomicrobiia bacterium]